MANAKRSAAEIAKAMLGGKVPAPISKPSKTAPKAVGRIRELGGALAP